MGVFFSVELPHYNKREQKQLVKSGRFDRLVNSAEISIETARVIAKKADPNTVIGLINRHVDLIKHCVNEIMKRENPVITSLLHYKKLA